MVVEYVQYNIGDKMDEDTDYGGDGGDSEDQYGLGTSESGGSVGGYGMPPGGPGVEVNPQGAPLSTSDIFGQPKLDTIPGPSGGGGGASASGMNYQLGLQQLQEQIREFNVQDQARIAPPVRTAPITAAAAPTALSAADSWKSRMVRSDVRSGSFISCEPTQLFAPFPQH